MNELVNQNSIEFLARLFTLATALIFFWFIEAAWRTDKRWIIAILLLPISIFIFVIANWEENRAKCFFAALLLTVMLIVGGLVGYSFYTQGINIIKIIAFWPFYLATNVFFS